jgi:hypothetical protein
VITTPDDQHRNCDEGKAIGGEDEHRLTRAHQGRRGDRRPAAPSSPCTVCPNDRPRAVAFWPMKNFSAVVSQLRLRLVRRTPSLRAQEDISREHMRLGIVEALGRRVGVDAERDMRPHVLASLALAPLDAAFVTCFGARSGEDICDLVDEALATFEREVQALCSD